jgi:hypothetical protein
MVGLSTTIAYVEMRVKQTHEIHAFIIHLSCPPFTAYFIGLDSLHWGSLISMLCGPNILFIALAATPRSSTRSLSRPALPRPSHGTRMGARAARRGRVGAGESTGDEEEGRFIRGSKWRPLGDLTVLVVVVAWSKSKRPAAGHGEMLAW